MEVQSDQLELRARPRAARSRRAHAASEKPNFESACPVEIALWVSPATSGVTRISTSWRRPQLGGHPLEPVELVERVDHDVADAAPRAPRAAPSTDFALPWR